LIHSINANVFFKYNYRCEIVEMVLIRNELLKTSIVFIIKTNWCIYFFDWNALLLLIIGEQKNWWN